MIGANFDSLNSNEKGDAMTGNVEPSVREQRQKFLGGSDIAAVIGMSRWKTPYQLWLDKTTPPSDKPEANRNVKARGKVWEAVVAEMLVDELQSHGHKVEVLNRNARYQDKEVPYFACEVDFELRMDDDPEPWNVELKTVHPLAAGAWGESFTDQYPVDYAAQCAWGLGVTGRRRGILAPLFGADEIRVYAYEADDDVIPWLRTKGREFWEQYVVPKVPPPATTVEDLNSLYAKQGESGLLADSEMTELILQLRQCSREIDAANAKWDLLEFRIKSMMKDASHLFVGEKEALTWREQKTSVLDQKALREQHPTLVKEFTRTGSTRVFKLKNFAWKE